MFINVLILAEITSVRHVYEIGITPNFKFGFCNYTSLYLLRDVTFRRVIAKFSENVETELRKVDK